MSLLAAANYDPAAAVTKPTNIVHAMTAFDTANLRVAFTAPTSGNVLVRMQVGQGGSTTMPGILLGILEGTTVVRRVVPKIEYYGNATGTHAIEALFTVTGLTPGLTYTWDAAYGVEYAVTSTVLRYGGPNDAVGSNAFGAFLFEVWTA